MRWERLFADLDAQIDAAERADRDAEVADRTRLERSRLRLAERLAAAVDSEVALGVQGAPAVRGRLGHVGPDWLLVTTGAGAEALVGLAAVTWVDGVPALADATSGPVAERLGLGYALRRLARDRVAVTVLLRDGTSLTGTIDMVGADAFDIAEHPADLPRRPDAVSRTRLVPFGAVAVVRPA